MIVETDNTGSRRDEGVVLISLLAVLIPLLVMVLSSSSLIGRRTSQLGASLDGYRALQAAESGIDEAIYRAHNGMLVPGQPFTVTIANDLDCRVTPTDLGFDGLDNDGDGDEDEADEQVLELVAEGRFRTVTARIAVYLHDDPPQLDAALVLNNPAVTIALSGSTDVSGFNHNPDGTRGDARFDVYGLAIAPPATVDDLALEIDASEAPKVDGLGGPPSLGTNPRIDVDAIVAHYRQHADVHLGAAAVRDEVLGSLDGGSPQSTFRDGNLSLNGNDSGAGLLVVNGDLRINGNARFDGIIVVTGDIVFNGTADIYGGVIQGAAGARITDTGNSFVHYSASAIAVAESVWTGPFRVRGWQELGRGRP